MMNYLLLVLKQPRCLEISAALIFHYKLYQAHLLKKGAHSKYGVVKFDNTYMFIGGGEK